MIEKISTSISNLILLTLAILAYLFCLGCSSTPTVQFSEIKMGMDKDQVLQAVGNPYRTEKGAVKEKWGYRYYEGKNKEKEILKFIEFINGRVANFGDDELEMKRLEQLRENEIKRKAIDQKLKKVEDTLNKEYSH
jgi:outer membrane protein assembly factor BamE